MVSIHTNGVSYIKYLFKTQEKREKGKYNVNWPLGTTIIIYNNTDSKFLETDKFGIGSCTLRYICFINKMTFGKLIDKIVGS